MNIFLIIVFAILVIKIALGIHRGMVREILAFIAQIVMCIIIIIVVRGIDQYLDNNVFEAALSAILLAIVAVVHHLIGTAFAPAKLVTKLPLIKGLDKTLGAVAGICETMIILWTVFTIIMMLDSGMIGMQILEYVSDSKILSWCYSNNLLAGWLDSIMGLGF